MSAGGSVPATVATTPSDVYMMGEDKGVSGVVDGALALNLNDPRSLVPI